MKRFYHTLIVLILLAEIGFVQTLAAGVAYAPGQWISTDMSRSRLISATTGTGQSSEVLIGLQIELDKGWKTYWRNPGDAGLPPQFNWAGSSNLKSVEILWPQPSLFQTYGFLTWGYQTEIVFPIKVTLIDPQKGLDVNLQTFYGICAEV
ncbi:MAG: hypothetical protein JKX94_12150, partial [Sneathiella sp.]|nr:hypothetical protein [Sneathiella sp.]